MNYEFTLPEGEHEVLRPVKQRGEKISRNADIPDLKKPGFDILDVTPSSSQREINPRLQNLRYKPIIVKDIRICAYQLRIKTTSIFSNLRFQTIGYER
jgi:hypothetical protein